MIEAPPLDNGADQVNVDCPLSLLSATKLCGAVGALNAGVAVAVLEDTPVPTELVALTLKS